MDLRNKQLAKNLVNYSCRLQKGEKILIEAKGVDGLPLVAQIIKEVYAVGGVPFVQISSEIIDRELLLHTTEEQLNLRANVDKELMDKMQAYIGVRSGANTYELADVSPENLQMLSKLYNYPVHTNIRVAKTKWVVLRYPNASMAQLANLSQEAFAEFYYNVCNLDYAKMNRAMDPLQALLKRTDSVHIKGNGTDLRFSVKDIPSVKCAGECNIPDGEIYTAPARESVNGVITFNTPSLHGGFTYEKVKLTFKNGKVTEAEANDTKRLEKVLDTDAGSRFIGEFAFGVNPYIKKPMLDILFDEKIMGSFHMALGSSYKSAYNGNDSALHWDLICIQTPEMGGGEIYFDDVLVRKDGSFVVKELEGLNPENLA